MEKYYFTYGTAGHPYSGGWTEVVAPDMDTACNMFNAVHPGKYGLLNCAAVYTESQMKNTTMYENGNFGVKCREIITINIMEEQDNG